MFAKAPRFPPEKPSDTPGPNQYTIPEQEGWDSYKRGAFLEKADRFSKERAYEGPDEVPSTSDQNRPAKDASRNPKRADTAPNTAALRQQLRIESLLKQATQLESQLSSSQKTQTDLKREAERAAERERQLKLKLERVEAGSKDAVDRTAKYTAMRKELDDLTKLHEDGKKAHRTEVQQLKAELERLRKSSQEQHTTLRRQLETAEIKVQESKKSLQSANGELADLRIKLRTQEGQKAMTSEVEQLKKNLTSLETAKRERDTKVAEVEKALQTETKQREAAEAKLKTLETRLEEALSAIGDQKVSSDDALASAEVEVANTKELLRWCSEQYGTLVAQSVSKSQLEEEKMLRLEMQSRLIKMERKLHDKDVQSNELVAYLRYKEEEQNLLRAMIKDAEAEISFLRSSVSKEDDRVIDTEMPVLAIEDSRALYESDRSLAGTMEEYYRSWLNTVLDEYKTAAHVAGSLSSTLDNVLSRTSELDGELQVARIEVEAARKRSREADEETGTLVQQVEELKAQIGQTSESATKEKEKLVEELADVRRKLEEGRKRQERLETTVREKAAAEKALSDDVEGLSEALKDAMRYEHAYKALTQEVDALIARNELVEREADHLSRFNAEILGHTNPNQKIHYLDRIRRDLADTKQRLAVSTRQRDAVLEDNDTLRNELHAYRSVSESTKPSHMTRVSRLPVGASSTNGPSPIGKTDDQTLVTSRRREDPMTLDELM
ncbi:hypothetical protein CPB86DRAFT_697389 [Serendipita vermifera]|nr:hypothetical protein CPB86DRAFT_697389 [Serendipita vermifera]